MRSVERSSPCRKNFICIQAHTQIDKHIHTPSAKCKMIKETILEQYPICEIS